MNGVSLSGKTDRVALVERIKEIDPFHTIPAQDDIASGQVFAKAFGEIARYNIEAKSWYVYDGVKWAADVGDTMSEYLAQELARALWVYAADVQSSDYSKYVCYLQSRNSRLRMINDAKALLPCRMQDFDKDPYLFNCQNYVLDLRNHVATAHNPNLMLSKVANVEYDPDASSELFENFMRQIMLDDRRKIEYLQTLIGYAMTGTNEREEAYMLFGSTTRNGKGTLTNTICHLFGDYGSNIQPESLAMQKNRDSRTASGDIARLNGVRFLQMSEPPKRMKIDVALLKTLLGRDKYTARNLYEREFEFVPCFKLFINTNFLPVVLDDTLFSSGRVKVVTFDRHFDESEQDKTLKDRLQAPESLSGILNWMLRGLKLYHAQKNTIAVPESVKLATEEYRHKSDKVQNFIEECLIPTDEDVLLKAKLVYDHYSDWCESNGYSAESRNNFYDELRAKGILIESRTFHGKTYRNTIQGYAQNYDDV